MRTLGDIPSNVQIGVKIELTPVDQGCTFVHCLGCVNGIQKAPLVSWQGPMMSGLGLPSGYSISIAFDGEDGLSTLKNRLPHYHRATARLTVTVGSQSFQPHFGRVRGPKRSSASPQILDLPIFDRLQDDDLSIPATPLANSWSNVHPSELQADVGYPLYYGKHTRPFYFVAVSSDADLLVGPRNVSSTNHVGSLWYSAEDSFSPYQPSDQHMLLLKKEWQQQSGSTNVACGNLFVGLDPIKGFVVCENTRGGLYQYAQGNGNLIGRPIIADVEPTSIRAGGMISVGSIAQFSAHAARINAGSWCSFAHVGVNLTLGTRNFKLVGGSMVAGHSGTTNVNSRFSFRMGIFVSSGEGTYTLFGTGNAGNTPLTFSSWVVSPPEIQAGAQIAAYAELGTNCLTPNVRMSIQWAPSIQLRSSAYRRFSSFALMQNCAEIAISENPLAIINHVCSHEIGLPFIQNSTQQTSVDNQKVQCLFYDRRPVSDVFDELLRISRTLGWIADSGMFTTRVYANSANASINVVIDERDFIDFSAEDAPLGASLYDQNLACDIIVKYGYQHWNGDYVSSLRASPVNTPMCNSAAAAGIGATKTLASEYILAADVASRWLGFEVGRYCQGSTFIEAELDHRYMHLELGDVIKVNHRVLVGSQDLFQVMAVRHDYGTGRVQISAGRLIDNG